MGKFGALRERYATTSDPRWFIPTKFRTGVAEQDALAPQILLAPYGITNKMWSSVQNSINKKDRDKLNAGELSNEKARKITMDIFLAACVRDWKNIPDAKAAIPFSAADARELFEDSEMSELYLEALEYSRDLDNFLVAEAAEATGN